MESARVRSLAVLEVALVLLVVLLSLWVTKSLVPVSSEWERKNLGQPFIWNAVFLVVLPLLVLVLAGRNPGLYGITFDNLKRHLDVGFMSLIVMGTGSGIAFPLIGLLGSSPLQWKGALILAAFYAVSLLLVAALLRKKQAHAVERSSGRRLVVFLGVLVALFTLSVLTLPYTNMVANVVYPVFFIGFGEEILFRGYVQGRLNDAFGRPYKLLGIKWGLGLILAALLFGLIHPLSALTGGEPLSWGWGLWTFFAGLVFGFLREKTGGVVAPAIAHGVPESIPFIFFGGV